MDQLTLQYRYDAGFFDPRLTRDDFGRLSVSVRTERFSGRGGFWVQWQEIREFSDALAVFPIPENDPVIAQWGFDMQDGDNLILRIAITPANRRGDLEVRCEIADDYKPAERVRASFITSYAELGTFRESIRKVMDREIDEAVLIGK